MQGEKQLRLYPTDVVEKMRSLRAADEDIDQWFAAEGDQAAAADAKEPPSSSVAC